MKKLALFALAVTLMLMGCKKYPLTPDEPAGSTFGRALRSLDIEEIRQNPSALKPEDRWLYATYSNALIVDMLDNFIPNTTCPILFVYAKDDPWTGARPDRINEQYSKMVINPIGVHNHDLNNVEHFTPEMKQDIMDFIARYVPYGDDPVVAKRSPYSHYVEMDDKFMIRK